jgi:hypothetical protein
MNPSKVGKLSHSFIHDLVKGFHQAVFWVPLAEKQEHCHFETINWGLKKTEKKP